jgi:hypothetical protein
MIEYNLDTEHSMSHFVSAEIKHFPAGQIQAARQWIMNGS